VFASVSFILNYELDAEGRAAVTVSNGRQIVESRVSHVHDSLLDLAKMALSLRAGAGSARAIFVVDPGELQLSVEIENEQAHFELRQFNEWASLNRNENAPCTVVLQGTTSTLEIIRQVTGVLSRLNRDIGPGQYEALWGQHEFPRREFAQLQSGAKTAAEKAIDTTNLVLRIFLIVIASPAVYVATYWIVSLAFSAYGLIWVPNTIALLVALEAGWVLWTRSGNFPSATGLSRAITLSAIVAGGAGFAIGFYGPMMDPASSPLDSLYGLLVMGPIGMLTGGFVALVYWKISRR
jgi:hypothetical protein